MSFQERVEICRLRGEGLKDRAIGRALGRAHTTISREVAADRDTLGGYYPRRAHLDAARRAARPKALRLAVDEDLRGEISHWLRAYYWIGRYLERAEATARLLAEHHQLTVEDRSVPGHWEGDLVEGSKASNSAIVTLVERQTRYLITCPLPNGRTSDHVITAIRAGLRAIPERLRKTLTWDQGSEMARHLDLAVDPQIKVYFCDPHSPWQRPSNENTNGLIREYYPKGTDFHTVPADELQAATDRLNNRPRNVLDFATPSETFAALLHLPGATTT